MTVVMFDAVEAANIPATAQAAAGYVGGRWPDYLGIVQRFPHLESAGRLLSIAVNDTEAARCLDVETGDASPNQAPSWAKRMLARGVWKPCLYANRSTMPAVIQALSASGLHRDQYRLWVADWTFAAHIPSGFDACQWTDRAYGGRDDQTLALDSFFPSPHHAPQPHGICHALLTFDMGTGRWHVAPRSGHNVSFAGHPDRWASAEVQLHEAEGHWRVRGLDFNAPPLGK